MSSVKKPHEKKQSYAGTIAIFSIFILFLGYFIFIEKDRPATTESTPTPTETYELLSFTTSEVNKITIQGATSLLELNNNTEAGQWEIVNDENIKADSDKVMTLIKDIQALEGLQKLTTEETPEALGLAPITQSITITKQDGSSQTLIIGKKTPAAERYYVQVEGSTEIYIIGATVTSILEKTGEDLKWVPPTPTPEPTATENPDTQPEKNTAPSDEPINLEELGIEPVEEPAS